MMIDSCKRASAERITAVIPYYGYARQDRKDEGRVPITAKLVANLITRAGADRVLAMDLHAAQIQGFFDVPVDHLYAAPVLVDHFQNQGINMQELVVVSPDEGSTKRALRLRREAGRRAGDRRQAPQQRRNHPAGEHHRRAGEGEGGDHVRRHDQHGRLDLRRGQNPARAGGQGDFRRRDPRRACAARRSSGCKASPIREVIITDSIPLRPSRSCPRSRCSAWRRCWARRSSASTATSRSAGCSCELAGRRAREYVSWGGSAALQSPAVLISQRFLVEIRPLVLLLSSWLGDAIAKRARQP